MIIVDLQTQEEDNQSSSMEEIKLLAETAGGKVIAEAQQKREKIDPAYYIGKGKALELGTAMDEMAADLLVINGELSPTQLRNLENLIGGKIIDRTALILDIFARRALSRQGRLQVELAQLNYLLPRLTGRGVQLSRLGGGIGTRGPGETKLEVDRRRIKKKISSLKKEINEIRKHRDLHRKSRRDKGYLLVALVGYTNAGKSTLLNALTNSQVFTENKLFATLDPAVRELPLESGENILLSDTVGFIKDLPPQLIEAFSATLEELQEADLLLHVVDITSPELGKLMSSVNEILSRLGIDEKQQVVIFNKIDALSNKEFAALEQKLRRGYPSSVFISAERMLGITELQEKIESNLKSNEIRMKLFIPYDRWPSFHRLYEKGRVLKIEYQEQYVQVEAEVKEKFAKELSSFEKGPQKSAQT